MSRKQEVCRDFQRGNCRFGSRCKYLHTAPQQPQQQRGYSFNQPQSQRGFNTSAFNQPQQRSSFFPPTSSNQQQQQQQNQNQNQIGATKDHKCIDVRLCKDQIREDFSNERPSFWRLTSYAHWRFLPNDVTGDVSFEELRAHAYDGAKQGMSIQQVAQREAALVAAKNSEFENLLKNYRGPAAAPNSGTVSPFLSPSASASPFLTPPASGPMLFPSRSPPAASGFAQPFQQPVPSSPFQSSGAFQPSTGFMSPVGSVGNFLANNPFAVQPIAGGVSWPSPSSNSPFNNPSASGPFSNPFSSGQAASPFPSAHNSSSSNSPISSPFTVAPGATQGQNSFSFFTNSAVASSVNTSSSATVQVTGASEDKWSASSWSIGEIPEEEPPVHVR